MWWIDISPGLEADADRLRLVDLDRDLLAAREQVVAMEGVEVRQLVDRVRARDELHVAVLRRRVGERDPGGDDVGRLEPPVGRVLVPGDEAGAARLLDEEVGGPAEDVGADHVGHRVEDRRMVDELVGPGEQQVRLVPQVALQRRAGDRLVGSRAGRGSRRPRPRSGRGSERRSRRARKSATCRSVRCMVRTISVICQRRQTRGAADRGAGSAGQKSRVMMRLAKPAA